MPSSLDSHLVATAAIVGLLLLAGIALAIRLRGGRLRRRARELELQTETVVDARTRELRAELEALQQALEELKAAKAQIEATHGRLVATFNQLRVGVIIVDANERVLFMSDAARPIAAGQEVTGQEISDQQVTGEQRRLEDVLPIGEEAMASLRAQLRAPQPGGVRVTAEVGRPTGQHYWADIEVRPDPGDGSHRVLYLYDVTETFDLKRALRAESRQGRSSLLGQSMTMRSLRHQIVTVGSLDATVLIEGETGTGKELVARAIHDASPRKSRPFVAVNCAGLTESILASQLFGHRRGAFTGAVSDQVGLFEAANEGTLLLDEIGDMPLSVQTHLLRVLQEREILRVGDSKPRPIDVRLLAATHRDLELEVEQGRFREDLLYRIRVVRMRVPPLRQRVDDIPVLAAAFLRQAAETHRLKIEGIGRDAMEHLQSHRWPGNVRELKAAIEGAAIRATGPVLRLADVLPELPAEDVPSARGPLSANERRLLIDALRKTGGNRSAAARLLGVGRTTLYRRLAALSADDPDIPPEPPSSEGSL